MARTTNLEAIDGLLGGPAGPPPPGRSATVFCCGLPLGPRPRTAPFATGRTPLGAGPALHTAPRRVLCPQDAAFRLSTPVLDPEGFSVLTPVLSPGSDTFSATFSKNTRCIQYWLRLPSGRPALESRSDPLAPARCGASPDTATQDQFSPAALESWHPGDGPSSGSPDQPESSRHSR